MKLINLSLALALLGAGLLTASCQSSESASTAPANESQQGAALNAQSQKATIIVDNGFSPSTIKAKAGQPLEITFDTKHHGCANAIVFKELNIQKPLKDGEKTIVTFTPSKAGSIEFACDMNMIKGSVEVQ